GIIPRHQELNPDAILRVAQVLAAREWRDVAEPLQVDVNLLKSFPGDEDVHVLREPRIPVEEHGHGPGDRVGNAEFIEATGNSARGRGKGVVLLEVHASLLESPPAILTQALLIDNHGSHPAATFRQLLNTKAPLVMLNLARGACNPATAPVRRFPPARPGHACREEQSVTVRRSGPRRRPRPRSRKDTTAAVLNSRCPPSAPSPATSARAGRRARRHGSGAGPARARHRSSPRRGRPAGHSRCLPPG